MDTLAHMLDLGWIIYTSKHSCVYSLIRWEKKRRKKEPGPALLHSVFAVSVWPNWVLPLEETAFTQFSFLFEHPHSFFQKWLFPRISVHLLAGSFTWGEGSKQSAFLQREWRCSCVFVAEWSFLLFLHPDGQSWIQQTPSEEVFHWDNPTTR